MNVPEARAAYGRARRLYKSPRFRNAYVRGALSADAGLPMAACPYRPKRGWAAWRRSWLKGYQSVAAKRAAR